jgi:hypothetical protein
MTLKEKFKKIDIVLSKNHTTKIVDREAIIMVKIADDYAIEFAHWCEWQDDKAFKTFQELLEMFKKEKGL